MPTDILLNCIPPKIKDGIDANINFKGQLKEHQIDFCNRILKEFQTNGSCIANMVTGGGKTVIFSKIIENLGLKTLVVAHTKELVQQIKKTLNDLTGVKFEFKENTFLLFIENSGNFRHIYTKLFQCLLDIYGEPKNGYFMRYNEVKNKYIKVDLPLTLNNDTYKISLKISREKKYIENNI